MSIFDFAVILITAPAIATLCYGAYLCFSGKDQASAPRVQHASRSSAPLTSAQAADLSPAAPTP